MFAGVFVALIVQMLLNMLGIGIGAATLDPVSGDNPAVTTFSIGAAIWWTLAGIVASFIGGHTAGRLSGQPIPNTGAWHGLISWALGSLLIVALLTTMLGSIVGGSLKALSSAVGGVGGAASQIAGPMLQNATDPFGAIDRQVRQSTGGQDPRAVSEAASAAVKAALTGDESQAQAAREQAAQVLSTAQNVSIEEARTQIEQYEAQYRQAVEQAKAKAAQAAETASRAASRGALFGFIALVLGAVAAWFGGRGGAVGIPMLHRRSSQV